jgi:RNA polymerase sigma-70 factor (ECF subfamily)
MIKPTPDGKDPDPKISALEDAMVRYQKVLLRYTARVLHNQDAAQDVVQLTFMRLHANMEKIMKKEIQLKGWLFRTAHNAAVDFIRKESRLRLLHSRQAVEMPRSENISGQEVDREALVLRHLNVLKPKEREVLVLRLQEKMSYREIANVLNHSEGYVGTLIHTATKKLTQSLQEAGVIA